MLRGFPSRRDLGRARIQTGKQIQSRPHRDAAQACQPPALFQKEFQTVSPAPIYPECPGGGSHAPCSARRLGSWLWPGGRCSDLCRSFLRLIFMDGLPWCPSIWCCPRSAEPSRAPAAAARLPGSRGSCALILFCSVLFRHVYGVSHGKGSDYAAWLATWLR